MWHPPSFDTPEGITLGATPPVGGDGGASQSGGGAGPFPTMGSGGTGVPEGHEY